MGESCIYIGYCLVFTIEKAMAKLAKFNFFKDKYSMEEYG